MVAPPRRKTERANEPGKPGRGHGTGKRSESQRPSSAERDLARGIGRTAGPQVLGAVAGLQASGLSPDVRSGTEKEKLSITLDKSLVEEIRAHSGQRALSTSINELLHAALAQERLGQLVDELEQEAGPASAQAYERVLAQWFASE